MEISCSEDEKEKEEWHSEKRLKTCEEKNKDFISGLPDQVIVHILSYLPLKDAVRTVLFRRFGKLWLSMLVLDLDNCADHDGYEICYYDELMDIIHQVWSHCTDTELDKLRLRLPYLLKFPKNEPPLDPGNEHYGLWAREKNAGDQIERLICYAIRRKVKALDLHFKGCDVEFSEKQFCDLPDVFMSNHLTDLRLSACEIRSCEKLNLQALRVLFLKEVVLSDQVMAKVLLECPCLEDLSLVDCYGLRSLNCENPTVKKLKIDLNSEKMRFFISCPHVISLEISGRIERAKLFDVSSLVDASVDFSRLFRGEKKGYLDVWGLMDKLRRCKTFNPCRYSILVLSIWELTDIPSPPSDWKNIRLELSLTKWHFPGLLSLLNISNDLETLTMHINSHEGDSFFQSEKSKWIWEYDFDAENYWDSQVATLPFLETLTIYGHIYKPYAVKMVKFLLRSAPNLQKLVILNKNDEVENLLTSKQFIEVAQELLTSPKASSQARLYFS